MITIFRLRQNNNGGCCLLLHHHNITWDLTLSPSHSLLSPQCEWLPPLFFSKWGAMTIALIYHTKICSEYKFCRELAVSEPMYCCCVLIQGREADADQSYLHSYSSPLPHLISTGKKTFELFSQLPSVCRLSFHNFLQWLTISNQFLVVHVFLRNHSF